MKRRAFFNRAAALLLSDFWLGNHILLSSRLRPPFRQGGDSPPKDPWPAADLVEPKQFAARLQANASKVSILYVGFPYSTVLPIYQARSWLDLVQSPKG